MHLNNMMHIFFKHEKKGLQMNYVAYCDAFHNQNLWTSKTLLCAYYRNFKKSTLAFSGILPCMKLLKIWNIKDQWFLPQFWLDRISENI